MISSAGTGATAIAGGLVGFLTVGLLGSTMDTARLSMLFYLGALLGGLLAQRKTIMEEVTSYQNASRGSDKLNFR